jgi:hypothetical protein
MQEAIRRLRLQARRAGRGKPSTGVRYPAEFRSEAVAVARRLRAEGVPTARIARDLGLQPQTLGLWLCRKQPARIRRVVVATVPGPCGPSTQPILVTAHGHRIEGLDLDALVQVLRSIA